MIVRESCYIAGMRDACARLDAALRAEFPYASVLLQDARSARWSVSAAGVGMRVDPAFTGRGAVIRVHDGSGYGEYALNDFCAADIPLIVERLKKMSPLSGGDPAPAMPEALTFHKATVCEIDPEEMGGERIVARLEKLRAEALGMDGRLLDCMVAFGYQVIHKRFVSGARVLEQDLMWSECMMNCVARRGEEVKECYRSFSMLGGAEILDRLRASIKTCVDGVIDLGQPARRAGHVRLRVRTARRGHHRARGVRPRRGDGHVREIARPGESFHWQADRLAHRYHARHRLGGLADRHLLL
jgi:predicted Zn-dependent protease